MAGTVVSPGSVRAFEKRRVAERKAWRAGRDNSQGPASPVRRIDPTTGQRIEPITLTAANLTTGAPAIDQPRARMRLSREGQRAAWRIRKRRQKDNKNAGALVLPPLVIEEDLRDAMGNIGCFIGRDPNDLEDVAQAIIEALWNYLMRR